MDKMKNYYNFSDSTFPVLLWIKAGCPRMAKGIKKHTFSRKKFLAQAVKAVTDHQIKTAGKYA